MPKLDPFVPTWLKSNGRARTQLLKTTQYWRPVSNGCCHSPQGASPKLTHSGLSARAQHMCCIECDRTDRHMMRCETTCAKVIKIANVRLPFETCFVAFFVEGHEGRSRGDEATPAMPPKASDQTTTAANFRLSINRVGLFARSDWQPRAIRGQCQLRTNGRRMHTTPRRFYDLRRRDRRRAPRVRLPASPVTAFAPITSERISVI